MSRAPVELDDQPLRSPEAVDLVPAPCDEEVRVELGPRKPARSEEPPEERFELTRDGYSGYRRHFVVGQGRAMDRDPGRSWTLSWDRGLEPAGPEQPKERAGRSVTQNGVRPASEHRRHPATVGTDERVTDRVDAAMDDVQPRGSEAMADCAPADSDFEQLRPRHDPMLASRDLGDAPIHPSRMRFGPYVGLDLFADLHPPSVARRSARVCALRNGTAPSFAPAQ
jgi:hypothetical protein